MQIDIGNGRIVTAGHPALEQTAMKVPEGENLSTLITIMWSLMYQHQGIGLAANQVGVLKRVIVVHADNFKQCIINPEIIKEYGGRHTGKEGCLSFPGQQATRARSKQIIVKGFDENWKPIKRKLRGLTARCILHEIDHLNGITIEMNKYEQT